MKTYIYRHITQVKPPPSLDHAIWLIPASSPLKSISEVERKFAKDLPLKRAKEFSLTRAYARDLLSKVFGVSPLQVPLIAPPGVAPTLPKGWGYISFSHCKDAILLGWSMQKIGVDIERTDRIFDAKSLVGRFYSNYEKNYLNFANQDLLRLSTLEVWVLKEACIKCQKGSISLDFSEWIINNTYDKAINKSINTELKTYLYQIKSWSIGIAEHSLKRKSQFRITEI